MLDGYLLIESKTFNLTLFISYLIFYDFDFFRLFCHWNEWVNCRQTLNIVFSRKKKLCEKNWNVILKLNHTYWKIKSKQFTESCCSKRKSKLFAPQLTRILFVRSFVRILFIRIKNCEYILRRVLAVSFCLIFLNFCLYFFGDFYG